MDSIISAVKNLNLEWELTGPLIYHDGVPGRRFVFGRFPDSTVDVFPQRTAEAEEITFLALFKPNPKIEYSVAFSGDSPDIVSFLVAAQASAQFNHDVSPDERFLFKRSYDEGDEYFPGRTFCNYNPFGHCTRIGDFWWADVMWHFDEEESVGSVKDIGTSRSFYEKWRDKIFSMAEEASPGLHQERWAISPSEFGNLENLTAFDHLVSTFQPENNAGECDGDAVSVIVQRNGIVTNRFFDGTTGVSRESRDQARDEETLYHPTDKTFTSFEETQVWMDVIVDSEGQFLRFADEKAPRMEKSSVKTPSP